METFGLKPISKNALIKCVEKAYVVFPKELADEIRGRTFGGVLIGLEDGAHDHRLLKAEVTDQPIKEEFDSYCCFAVRAAIFALLGDDVEQRFPYLEFTSCIRLDQVA